MAGMEGAAAMTFDDFFTDSEDYPFSDGFPDEVLPFGTEYCYVSSSFVNGFINSGDLVGAFMLNRYRQMDEVFDKPLISGKITYSSKQELISKLRDGPSPYHTDVSQFQDDVWLLKRLTSPDGAVSYLYIWCDCDVSDCCIGRFKTDLPEQRVVDLFYASGPVLAKHGDHFADPVPLELSWFQGWLSF